MSVSAKFLDRVDKLRRFKGITQADVAKKLGVKQATVAYYFSSGRVDLDTAISLAKAIDEDFMALLGMRFAPSPARARIDLILDRLEKDDIINFLHSLEAFARNARIELPPDVTKESKKA